MGATSSKVEEDKALQLCRERKKFVNRALDGRCALAATHFTYIESLTIIGNTLRRFIEPGAPPMESTLLYTANSGMGYTSNSGTPEPLANIEKSFSQISFSSQNVVPPGNRSPSPSPPTSNRYHTNHMKIRGSFSRKVEEKPSIPVIGSITSSNEPEAKTPEDAPITLPENQPWDYFDLPHPIDDTFSSLEVKDLDQNYKENEGISEKSVTLESEDEFDEPATDGLVRSFVNVNNTLPSMSSAESMTLETEILNREKGNSPLLSPLKRKTSGVEDEKTEVVKENNRDFVSSMRDIEHLFVRASECGREVPRMLEANKVHFRPIFPGKQRGSLTSKVLKACAACGDDPSQVQEEPAENDTKYLTWHRAASSRASSFRHDPNGNNTRESQEDLTASLFDSFYMNAGSHASTLDRLFAWEKKLYDEVKANQIIRKGYDYKRKLLRELESSGEHIGRNRNRIDKTRAIVKDLHWRIGVSIHRIDSISRRIEDLRDKELQPQLDELIEGLRRMWEVMHECHKTQFLIMSAVANNSHTKISPQLEITVYLESELNTLSSSFTKWIGAQKAYVSSLKEWLHKCVPLQQSNKKRRRNQPPSLKDYGPPIYVTCGVWLEKLETLIPSATKQVSDSIKDLAAEINHFLPRQEKGKHHHSVPWKHDDDAPNLLQEQVFEDRNESFDRLKSRLEAFLEQLSKFSGLSVEMFTDLQKEIQEKKNRYAKIHSQS